MRILHLVTPSKDERVALLEVRGAGAARDVFEEAAASAELPVFIEAQHSTAASQLASADLVLAGR